MARPVKKKTPAFMKKKSAEGKTQKGTGMTPAMMKQVDEMVKKGMPRSMAMAIVKGKAGKKAPKKK